MKMVCSSMPRKSLRRVICSANESRSSRVGVPCRSSARRRVQSAQRIGAVEKRLQVHIGVWREAGGYFLLPGQAVWIEKHHVGNIGLPRLYRAGEWPVADPFQIT